MLSMARSTCECCVRAMDLGGFHQVIFIFHTPLIWELAESILSVGNGCVVMGSREAAVTTE